LLTTLYPKFSFTEPMPLRVTYRLPSLTLLTLFTPQPSLVSARSSTRELLLTTLTQVITFSGVIDNYQKTISI
ncbi:hypothetical protein AB7341_19570, partial [Providencia huaxiensis]|uniref:hypothetical protein n=1 Tax=Providencia huaxiensis TaxID=2027290 RepID=UPI0034E49A09